jgi:hypothetical protein
LGSLRNFFTNPGYSDPSYLMSIGYQPGQGTGSLWPDNVFHGGAFMSPPGATNLLGLGAGPGGSIGDILAPVAWNQLKRGQIPQIGVPNPQEAAAMMKALASNRPYSWMAPPTMVSMANVRAAQPFLRSFRGTPTGGVGNLAGAGRPFTSTQ